MYTRGHHTYTINPLVHFHSHTSLSGGNFFLFIFLPFSEYSLPLFPNFLLKVALRTGCQDLRLQTHCFPMPSSGNLIRGEPLEYMLLSFSLDSLNSIFDSVTPTGSCYWIKKLVKLF